MTEQKFTELVHELAEISGMLTTCMWIVENDTHKDLVASMVDKIDCLIERTIEERFKIVK